MGRKNLLEGLMGTGAEEPPAPAASRVDPDRPRRGKGPIGAISRSVADLQARALAEIDPFLIDAGGLDDRIETDPDEDEALRRSIADYGQQVPVLVRPHPEAPGRFQIVYGRRRVLALRDLGRSVKALVRDLDDRDLVIAQGQENSARRDLSFIEKASFARQMAAAGYDRKIIGDTLSMDKTLVSRLLSVAERIAPDLIAAIGAAPSVGRDRWLALAAAQEAVDVPVEELIALVNLSDAPGSDGRFDAVMRYFAGLKARDKASRAAPGGDGAGQRKLRGDDGAPLAEASRKGGRLTLRMARGVSPEFEDWLLNELPALHASWRDRQG